MTVVGTLRFLHSFSEPRISFVAFVFLTEVLLPEDREKMASITVVGNVAYSSSGDIAQGMNKAGLRLPYFLEEPSSPNYVPPHIAALILHAQHLL